MLYFKYIVKSTKKININSKNNTKFIRDKLDNILSPTAKEYLKLEKELKSMNNNIFKRNTR